MVESITAIMSPYNINAREGGVHLEHGSLHYPQLAIRRPSAYMANFSINVVRGVVTARRGTIAPGILLK